MLRAAWITAFASLAVVILTRNVSGQDVCGVFRTAPGSSADYSYHDGTLNQVVIPVDVSFAISCQDFSLDAVINSPIIGVDETGTEIFPTGLSYPLSVSAPYSNGLDYYGPLSGTQYHIQWFFSNAGGGAAWDGTVGWIGGRFEQTDIENVQLIRVPECAGCTLLLLGLLIARALIVRTL